MSPLVEQVVAMAADSDPADVVRSFLDSISQHADELPDLFGDDPTRLGPAGLPAPSQRVRGLLSKLVGRNCEIALASTRDKGRAIQELITRGWNSGSICVRRMLEILRNTELERAAAMEFWFAALTLEDQGSIDEYCLTVAKPRIGPHLPSSLPTDWHAPLARLAMEDAGILRRAAGEREEYERSEARRTANHTVVSSALTAYQHTAAEVRARVLDQWFLTCPDLVKPTGEKGGGDATGRDGPEGGCWLIWSGKRWDVPKGVVYRLIDLFWSRDWANYDDLVGPVFDGAVEPQTIRARVSEASQVLKKMGIPWKLAADSTSRKVTKQRRE